MSVDLPVAPTPSELFAMEDRLLDLYSLRKSAGFDTADLEEAYSIITVEMYGQGLMTKGLPAVGDKEEASVGDGGSTGDGDTKQKTPKKPKQTDGPTVAKEYSDAGMLWTKGGTKHGKGGEGHRFLEAVASAGEGGVGGEDEEHDDDGVTVEGKAKRDKSGESNRGTRSVGKAATRTTASTGKGSEGKPTGGTSQKPAARPTPTRGPASRPPAAETSHGASEFGPPETHYTPHPFAPNAHIRAICDTCGEPISHHVGKFLGTDESWREAAEVIKSFTGELEDGFIDPYEPVLKMDFAPDEREQYAQNGVALPDGSFPIPNEAALHNAVRLVGHAADPMAAMHHIIERAKTMGMTHALPPAWNVADAGTDPEVPAAPPLGAHSMAPEMPTGPSASPSKSAGGAPKPAGAGAGAGPSAAPRPKPATPPAGNVMKEIATAFAKGLEMGLDTDTILQSLDYATSDTFEQYIMRKADDESRYTQGPVYMPGVYDAHGEWTTAEELQKSLWDYVRETGADRTVYLQHTSKPAGEWVEAFQWHYPVKATMHKSIGGVQKSFSVDLPAGTTYLGVIWEPWAWEMVKKEEITGLSMGGWAKRFQVAIGN